MSPFKLNPSYPAAHYTQLSFACLDASQHPKLAIQHLRQLTQADLCPPTAYYQLGRAYMQAGAWGQARLTFEQINNVETNADVQNDLGIIEAHLGNLKTAKAHLDSAVRLDRNLAAGYLNLAILEQHYLGQKQLALQYYQKFQELLPKSPQSEDIRAVIAKLSQETTAHPEVLRTCGCRSAPAQTAGTSGNYRNHLRPRRRPPL